MFFDASKLDLTFAPIPALDYARDFCLAHSQTRGPIWGIRIARDFVISIRPRSASTLAETPPGWPALVVRFECIAALAEGTEATAQMLTAPRHEIDGKLEWWWREFWIIGYAGDADRRWHLVMRGCYHARKSPIDTGAKLDKRIIATFSGKFFDSLTPSHMLGSSCLICGRPLSDPVSRARHVGPECANTRAIAVPFLLAKRK